MKKKNLIACSFIIVAVVSIFSIGCSNDNDYSKIDQKLIYLEQSTISQTQEIENIKIELMKANSKLDSQAAKIDTLISYNKELIKIINTNHAEDKGILSGIYEKITNYFK